MHIYKEKNQIFKIYICKYKNMCFPMMRTFEIVCSELNFLDRRARSPQAFLFLKINFARELKISVY